MKRVLVVGAAAVLVTACGNLNTQISTLKPVAGDAITELNIAANDVLLGSDIPVLVAPVCRYEPETYTCEGTTTANAAITVTAEGATPETFSVTVGDRMIFRGSIDDVIARAGQR